MGSGFKHSRVHNSYKSVKGLSEKKYIVFPAGYNFSLLFLIYAKNSLYINK